jgi:hypothetical protein
MVSGGCAAAGFRERSGAENKKRSGAENKRMEGGMSDYGMRRDTIPGQTF